jgi:putative oxidoreductase
MKKNNTLDLITFLLVLLFVYTAASKLFNFHEFEQQMHNQSLPLQVSTILIWTLPEVELLTALLLIFECTKATGFYLSAFLMFCFTVYIVLALLHFFNRIPCFCGGAIKAMGWKMHLWFNLFFLLLSTLGIIITNRERRCAN